MLALVVASVIQMPEAPPCDPSVTNYAGTVDLLYAAMNKTGIACIILSSGHVYNLTDGLVVTRNLTMKTAVTNECQPNKTCNVCAECCKEYIPDGPDCNTCVADNCPRGTNAIPNAVLDGLPGWDGPQILRVTQNMHLWLEGLDVTRGSVYGNAGGLDNEGGTVIVSNSAFYANYGHRAGGRAGAIYNSGEMYMSNCSVYSNYGNYQPAGGGICNQGAMTLTDCAIYLNTASGPAAGILNEGGDLTMARCTVYNNSASRGTAPGGGIYNTKGSNLTLSGCDVHDNEASVGGGVWNEGKITFGAAQNRVVNNTATVGFGYDFHLEATSVLMGAVDA